MHPRRRAVSNRPVEKWVLPTRETLVRVAEHARGSAAFKGGLGLGRLPLGLSRDTRQRAIS